MGSDFPPDFRPLIDTWGTNCTFRLDEYRLTTTAWNGYGENEHRGFKYLTQKLRLDENDLSDEQVLARSFHMVCSPVRCMSLVQGILERRRTLLRPYREGPDEVDGEVRPVFVWEPVPDLCTPEELLRLREAAGYADVVSPNAEEFASFFQEMPECDSRQSQVEWLVGRHSQISDNRARRKTTLVIREGAHGCIAYKASCAKGLRLRAYHQSKVKVIDPTGGGNTFLGALAIGLTGMVTPGDILFEELRMDHQRRLLLALIHATVAAGYAIEQIGMPNVSATDGEIWNGERYPNRFIEYLKRERAYINRQLPTNQDKP